MISANFLSAKTAESISNLAVTGLNVHDVDDLIQIHVFDCLPDLIASVYKRGMELESLEPDAFDTSGWGHGGTGIRDEHLITACKEHGVEDLWYMLHFVGSYIPDLENWIKSVESGRVREDYTCLELSTGN